MLPSCSTALGGRRAMELTWHRHREQAAGAQMRALVVLLPWVGARERDIMKYVELVDR